MYVVIPLLNPCAPHFHYLDSLDIFTLIEEPYLFKELKRWVHSKNIPTSRTTPYNPACNTQCERYIHIIWKALCLTCKFKDLHV